MAEEEFEKSQSMLPARRGYGGLTPRLVVGATLAAGLALAFARPLYSLALYAAGADLHSHILLVPFVIAYLIYTHRGDLPKEHVASPGWALIPMAAGLGSLAVAWNPSLAGLSLSENDFHALMAFAFVCCLTAWGFLFLGRKWLAAAAFPVGLLIFMVPLPDKIVEWLEIGSMYASAEAANLLLNVSGTPILRDGLVFQLPGIVVEVAQECSGIRSSWVLFITSVIASKMFLKSPWRRVVLVVLVIPLGILRNGFRILVIGLLCVHIGPHMIHSIVHKRGGPLFFALSLVPLFLLLWWLRRGDSATPDAEAGARIGPKL